MIDIETLFLSAATAVAAWIPWVLGALVVFLVGLLRARSARDMTRSTLGRSMVRRVMESGASGRACFLAAWMAVAGVVVGVRPVEAQDLGIAVRAGTLGLGGEVALGLGNRVVVRAGIGYLPLEFGATLDDIDVTLELPRTLYHAGVDLYLNSVIRIGGGFLVKPDGIALSATPTEPQDIGGEQYAPEEIGTLRGGLQTTDRAPYALIGFGKHVSRRAGLTLDLGVAFLRDTRVTLDSEGGTLSDDPSFRQQLDAQARSFEDDLPRYLELWPMVSLGFRIGIGP